MSTITYKHSLRRHVPSGRNQHSPTPSPPDTRPKSSAASIKSHHSKREKVKETVDHLLHKFHIPHHHHEHGHDGLLTPTDGTPEKKSFLVKRASFVGSLRTASSKRKSTAPGDDVPTLGYKASPASSSSSSLEDDHSSSGASSKSGQEEKAVVAASSQGIKSSRIPVPSASPAKPRMDAASTLKPVALKAIHAPSLSAESTTVVYLSAEQLAEEPQHHHSKREQVKEAVDHALHKLHIPHHHHHHQQPTSSSIAEYASTTSVADTTASLIEAPEEPSTASPAVPVALIVEVPAAPAEKSPESDSKKDEPIEVPASEPEVIESSEPLMAVVPAEPQISTPEPTVVESVENVEQCVPLNEVQEVEIVQCEEPVTEPATEIPAFNTAPITSPSSIVTAEPTPFKAVVASGSQIEASTVVSLPMPVEPLTIPISQSELSTAHIPTIASSTDPLLTSRKPIHTPVTVPMYFDLRRATASNIRKPTKKPSWFQYIYGSIVKPVVVIAVECTVAVVCYGLAKVLEVKPAPISVPTDQLNLA